MGRRPLVLISGKDPLGAVGGHESYVRAHALAAAACGFEPHVFCASNSIRGRTARADFGVVHYVPPLPGGPHPVVLQGPPLAREVARFLGGSPGPHLIHSFAIWAGAGVAASRALARRGICAVAVASAYGTRMYEVGAMQQGLKAHHGFAHRLRYRAWLRWVQSVDDPLEGRGYARSRLVLVNYESVRKILSDAYGPALEIRRLPYASPDAFEAEEPPARTIPGPVAGLASRQAPLILAVSRHDPRKGLDVLLLALGQLAAEGVAFRACLVGTGRLLSAHRRLAADLGLGEQVAIPGRVQDVTPYFTCADVFVLPSLGEASGSVSVLEALRAGTAVVASACDGIPEDLVDGVDALLAAPGDPRALAGALRTLLTDPARRAEIAVNARRAHETRFSAGSFANALQDVYAEVGVPSATVAPGAARTASAT